MGKFGDRPSNLPKGLESLLTSSLKLDEKGEAEIQEYSKEEEEKAQDLIDQVRDESVSSRDRVEKTNKNFLSALMSRLVSEPQNDSKEVQESSKDDKDFDEPDL